jgi:hypothetical protein
MTAYDWPAPRRRASGNGAARTAWQLERSAGVTPEALEQASALLRLHAGTPPVRRDRRGRRIARHAPPSADAGLWQPIGPFVGLRGQADSDPRVAGRIRDLKVAPDGERGYAAAANGGVWYTGDGGATWEAVGAFAMTRERAAVQPSSHTLVCGCLHVVFDPGGAVAGDEVWVGTGEVQAVFDPGTGGGRLGGVGILHARGPVATVRGDRERDPWDREAAALAGRGIYRIAADPAQPGRLLAATTAGLWLRRHDAAAGTDPWSLVTVTGWTSGGADVSGSVRVTDVVWPRRSRVWIAVRDATAGLTGLWLADGDPAVAGGLAAAGQQALALPPNAGVVDGTGAPTVRRIGLAASDPADDVVYVLASGPQMWRIDGTTIAPVSPMPPALFGPPTADQSGYDLAVEVSPQPGNSARQVIVGGSGTTSPFDGSFSAALYRLTLGAAPAGGVWPTDQAAQAARPPTWIGAEIHADVHAVRWVAAPGGRQVWVGCDGGVFRSARDGDVGSFAARNTGLEAGEAGAIANHPLSDAVVLAGLQDNGVQLRVGHNLWRVVHAGDGGGVAFDPAKPSRWVGQYVRASWRTPDGEITPPWRGPDKDADGTFGTENRASSFYSLPAVRRRTDGTVQLAVGTTRVWYTESWGRSRWDTGAGVFRRDWVTLPCAAAAAAAPSDPRTGNAADANTNDVPGGAIRVLRWVDDDTLLVLATDWVGTLVRAGGRWQRALDVARPAPPATPPATAVAAATPPERGTWNDVAVHDPATGSFYLATSNALEPVWWWDGVSRFHPSTLGLLPPPPPATPPPDGVRAPAYAVVVDPAHAEVVYAGTAVGVWRGQLTVSGGNPSWDWRPFVNGLPEAAVQDLAIGSWPVEGGGTLRLLRAALQARGVWEVDLDAPTAPRTFLRMHQHDTRRNLPTPMTDPLVELDHADRDWALDAAYVRARDVRSAHGRRAAHPDGTPPTEHLWHASPDVRVRPAPGAPAPAAPPGGGWRSAPSDRHALWVLQTALHGLAAADAPDGRLVVPDGRWTTWFEERLKRIRGSLGLVSAPVANAALWNEARVVAARYTDPWADGGPSEADLVERIVPPQPTRGSAASVGVRRGPARVDVLVHHRGQDPIQPGQVAVVLVRIPLPAAPGTWATLALPAVDASSGTPLRLALDALPPTAQPVPVPAGLQLPAGGVAVAAARPPRAVEPGRPVVVTFDTDFGFAAARDRFLLLAFVHSTLDPLTVPATGVRDAVRRSSHLAARSVEVM